MRRIIALGCVSAWLGCGGLPAVPKTDGGPDADPRTNDSGSDADARTARPSPYGTDKDK